MAGITSGMYKQQGIGLIALGVLAILTWALLRYLWIIGILLIILGVAWVIAGKK